MPAVGGIKEVGILLLMAFYPCKLFCRHHLSVFNKTYCTCYHSGSGIVDRAAAFKCDGYSLKSLLAGYLDKGSRRVRPSK